MDWMWVFSQVCVSDMPKCAPFWTGVFIGAVSAGSVLVALAFRQAHKVRYRRRRGDRLATRLAPALTKQTTSVRWQDRAFARPLESQSDISATIRARIRTVAETKRRTSAAIVVPLRVPPRKSL